MIKPVTIVVSPRDRYSNLSDCLRDLYANTDQSLFDLIVINSGYPSGAWSPAMKILDGKENFRICEFDRIIPMEAVSRVRGHIETPYTVLMDNDSRALAGWLAPLLESAQAKKAAVIYPVTLERSGVDAGAEVRTHLFTTELRVVGFEGKDYLIEHKTFRREDPNKLPDSLSPSEAFELHCVMFDTKVLQSIELPRMTIREHLDIGLQLQARGLELFVEPRSKILFDNLGSRAQLSDLKFFDLRWNGKITHQSSRLFEKRWGYNFYSEQSTYTWARRRRLFLLLRWIYIPVSAANFLDRIIAAIRRRLFPVWDPLPDPVSASRPLKEITGGQPVNQLSHELS